MDRKAVYVETSVVSYLTAVVIAEAGRGDSTAAARRAEALVDIPIPEITDAAVSLSKTLITRGVIPEKALDDSVHIAVAAVHSVDYLLTWNCHHIDNAERKPAPVR